MVIVIEIPHTRPPHAWWDFDKASFFQTCSDRFYNSSTGEQSCNKLTLKELKDHFAYNPENEEESLDWLRKLDEAYSDDTVLYCGYTQPEYSPESVDQFEDWCAWLGHDLSLLRVYASDEEALAAYKDDSQWNIHQGTEAREALRRVLIEAAIIEEEPEE